MVAQAWGGIYSSFNKYIYKSVWLWLRNILEICDRNANVENPYKYVEIKCQLGATEVFITDLIACSTCFGHHYTWLQSGNILHTVECHTSCHPTLQHHNSYNRTDNCRQWNAVGSPDDGRKDARNMLRYYWLPINHYLLHLVGLTFTYKLFIHLLVHSNSRLSYDRYMPLPERIFHRVGSNALFQISSILSVPWGHPIASHIFFFFVFPSLLFFLLSFLQ